MLNAVWLFIGDSLDTLARWSVSGFVARHWGEIFPLGTLVVNLTGSFIISLFATPSGLATRWPSI